MDISNLDKAEILAELYNNAIPLGMGKMHYEPINMTIQEAQKLLDSGQTFFDYVKGRVMKIDLSKDELNTRLYNRDNGNNAAENIISKIKPKQ